MANAGALKTGFVTLNANRSLSVYYGSCCLATYVLADLDAALAPLEIVALRDFKVCRADVILSDQ
jgi:hypothetical protein